MGDEAPGGVVKVFLPTYIQTPTDEERFSPSEVKKIAEACLAEKLSTWVYEEEEAKVLSVEICDQIRDECKKLKMPRYKIIVQATIGQLKGQGVRICSRCLWDETTDNYASASYQNQTLWASVMVFGLYTE